MDAALASLQQAVKYLVESSEKDAAYQKIMNYWASELVGDTSGTFQDEIYLEMSESRWKIPELLKYNERSALAEHAGIVDG